MSVTSQGNARTLLLGGFIKSKVDLLQFVSHKNTVGGNWEARGKHVEIMVNGLNGTVTQAIVL